MAKVQPSKENARPDFQTKKFPIEAFPLQIQQIIKMNCKHLNLNNDYSAASILSAFSVAMGNSYELKIKNKWSEIPTLFMAIVGKSGINKSSPMSVFMEPVELFDKELYEKYRKEHRAFENENRKGLKDGPELQPPIRKQVVIKDATQEAVLKCLFENNHGLIGIYDELASFLKGFNKYKSGGGDEELMLSLFSHKSISVNRKSSLPFLIDNPFFSLIGGIQPNLLVNLMGNLRIDNGLTQRFLFAYPDNVIREELSESDVPEEISTLYSEIILQILNPAINKNPSRSKIVTISKEAFAYYRTFRRRIDKTINEEKSDAISGIYAKLDIYFLRISLIIHVMRMVCNEDDGNEYEVSEITMRKTNDIIEYFEYTALKVFKLLEKHRDPLIDYPLEHKKLYYKLPSKFSTNEAFTISQNFVSRRTLFNILNDDYLFQKIKHGEYEKIW